MESKCPFQHKAFYDSMTLSWRRKLDICSPVPTDLRNFLQEWNLETVSSVKEMSLSLFGE